jgi:hypothetical protein
VEADPGAIRDSYPSALLTSVLKGKQRKERQPRRILTRGKNPAYSAFFSYVFV